MVQDQNTAVATVDAAKIKGEIQAMFSPARKGFEDGHREDLTIPRVRMLQSTSAEVKEDPRKFFPGTLINSITKETLPSTFIAVKRLPNNYVRFNARKKEDPNWVDGFEPGGVVWRTSDPKDERVVKETVFGPKGEVPPATAFMNFLCYFEGFTIPVVLSFSKTSYQAGKDFWTMCCGQPGDMFTHKYRVKAFQKAAKGNTFYVLSVEKAGPASADEIAIGATFYDAFKDKAVKVDEEHDEAANTGGDDASFPHGANAAGA